MMWIIKGQSEGFYLSVMCENMNAQIAKIKTACIVLNEDQRDDCSRRMAKNIKRLCEVRYRKFRACGPFTVDATSPLRLTGLITTYCVVLLQFAYL
ncbi:hypothetical protein EVAR_54135_1 [Eumeta japonica]|uniref:Uncharacterized protein n=1 Tax=Eumeta variegata TaxID=151549 RepID=A0A4C1YWY2_EUMVA|nr:hypothetical protein EVAR_54135_1 [Eumeta japonica]